MIESLFSTLLCPSPENSSRTFCTQVFTSRLPGESLFYLFIYFLLGLIFFWTLSNSKDDQLWQCTLLPFISAYDTSLIKHLRGLQTWKKLTVGPTSPGGPFSPPPPREPAIPWKPCRHSFRDAATETASSFQTFFLCCLRLHPPHLLPTGTLRTSVHLVLRARARALHP